MKLIVNRISFEIPQQFRPKAFNKTLALDIQSRQSQPKNYHLVAMWPCRVSILAQINLSGVHKHKLETSLTPQKANPAQLPVRNLLNEAVKVLHPLARSGNHVAFKFQV